MKLSVMSNETIKLSNELSFGMPENKASSYTDRHCDWQRASVGPKTADRSVTKYDCLIADQSSSQATLR
jgi:hypothetical protein